MPTCDLASAGSVHPFELTSQPQPPLPLALWPVLCPTSLGAHAPPCQGLFVTQRDCLNSSLIPLEAPENSPCFPTFRLTFSGGVQSPIPPSTKTDQCSDQVPNWAPGGKDPGDKEELRVKPAL